MILVHGLAEDLAKTGIIGFQLYSTDLLKFPVAISTGKRLKGGRKEMDKKQSRGLSLMKTMVLLLFKRKFGTAWIFNKCKHSQHRIAKVKQQSSAPTTLCRTIIIGEILH